ncbi:MAG: anchored repeat-type ABC transporter ATP-binding subunit [Pseudonocardiaceae bacterium]
MSAPPLEVSGLSIRLGGRLAVIGVDLRLGAGELIGLIGPNGAGKTTLMRGILGLLPTEAGRIAIYGRSPVAGRALVGYVPQRHEFAWEFPIDVAGAVLTAVLARHGPLRRPRPADRAAVLDALDQVGLADLRQRPIAQLSGGQRQRVLVARALAIAPRLLLLDEPFSGVDAPTRDVLTKVVTGFVAAGNAALLTTHDLVAAGSQCNRICLLNRRVVAEGPPTELGDTQIWMEAFGVPAPQHLTDPTGRVR